MFKRNAHIDNILSGDPLRWHIEQGFAQQYISKYLSNMELVAHSPSMVAVFERIKSMNAPVVLDMKGATVGIWDVMNPRQSGTIPPNSILQLNLIGPMMANGDMCTWGMDEFEQAIIMANANPNISGIFIRANTGGGESLAGQILHNAIKESNKAVVVYADTLASAGLHGTLASDEIIASGLATRIGSIGTYVSVDKEIAKWYSENVDDIYSEVSPDKNAEWRAYLAGDSKPLQTIVTQNAKLFQQEVAKYRPLNYDKETTLRGGMFLAQDAKKRGLIDGVGTLLYAMTRLEANIKRRKNS